MPTALIIGGSKKIGKAAVIAFAQQGYDVLFTWAHDAQIAQETLTEAKKYHYNIQTVQFDSMDILQPEGLERFDQIWQESQCKDLSVLVNNVGHHFGRHSILETPTQEIIDIFNLNVVSALEFAKFTYRYMAVSHGFNGGSIINLSSRVARFGGNQLTAYAMSKGAIESMTVCLAQEFGADKIRVNAIIPGLMPPNSNIMDNDEREKQEKLCQSIPMKSFIEYDDIAQYMLFLASDQSKAISGTINAVHGGRI